KSLVHLDARGDGAEPRRLAMYETVREYAAERLRATGLEDATNRRAEAVFSEMGAGGPLLTLFDRLGELLGEVGNPTVVHDRLLARSRVDAVVANRALRTACALYPIYFTRGPSARALERLDRSLSESLRGVADLAVVASAVFARGNMYIEQGRTREGL